MFQLSHQEIALLDGGNICTGKHLGWDFLRPQDLFSIRHENPFGKGDSK